MNNFKLVFRFGWPYLRRYWTRLLAGILLGLLFGLTNASFVWATRTLVDRFSPEVASPSLPAPAPAVQPDLPTTRLKDFAQRLKRHSDTWIDPWLPRAGQPMDWRRILGGLLLLPLLVGLRSVTEYGSGYCMGWVSERVINDLRLDVLGKLSTLSLDFFARSSTGDLLTRVNVDTANLLRCLKQGAGDLVKEPVTFFCVLGTLFLFDAKLTLLVMVFVPLCLFPLMVLGRKIRRASRASRQTGVLQASQLVELISNIRVIKAFNLEGSQMARHRKLSRALIHHGMKSVQAKELTNPIVEVISMFGLGLLIVYIFSTQTGLADFVGFLTGVMMLFLPIKKLARVHVTFEQAAPGVQRLAEIFQEQPTVRDPAQPKPWPAFTDEIALDRVSFGYEDRVVLQDVSLVIPRGQRIGLAGLSGSGKSTLVNLLFRFYDPTSGVIRVDGLDLREITMETLRKNMALVSQDVVIFDATVAENIAAGKLNATRDQIVHAARAAFAHEFISQLPLQYDTPLGERGIRLSGGQRQRVAIARAFVRDAPILVLDEATASLDSKAEAEVQAAIERLEENRTVVCVAHRLSTLAEMDRIIVLAEGRVVEQGTFLGLLEGGGVFAELARLQGIRAPIVSER